MSLYDYGDPVARDSFTALDVALLQIPFLVEGAQAHPTQAKLAIVVLATLTFTSVPIGALVSPTFGLLTAGIVAAVGYVLQLTLHLIVRKDNTPASTRPATWLATAVSVVHYATLLNLHHKQLRHDVYLKLSRVFIYLLHVFSLLTIVFILLVMEPLQQAWGCYGNVAIKDLDLGPCGESTALPWRTPQAVCRTLAFQTPDANGDVCTGKLTGLQYFDRHATVALHAQAVALALYTMASWHAFAVYWRGYSANAVVTKQLLAFF